jgi:hypothetical protein
LEPGRFHALIHQEQASALAGREVSGRFALRAGHVFSAARLNQESEAESGSALRP